MSFEIDRPIHLFPQGHSPVSTFQKEQLFSPPYDPLQAVSPTYSVASSSNGTSSSFTNHSTIVENGHGSDKQERGYLYDPQSGPATAMPVPMTMSPHSGTFSEQSVTGAKRSPFSPLPEAFYDCSPNFTTDQLRASLPTPPASDMSPLGYGPWRDGTLKSPPSSIPFQCYDAPSRPVWPNNEGSYYPAPACPRPTCSSSDCSYLPAPTPLGAYQGMIGYDHPSPLPSNVLMQPQTPHTYLQDNSASQIPFASHSPPPNAVHHQRRTRQHPYVDSCYTKTDITPANEPRTAAATPRRYKCTVCVKRFTRPSSLATHMHSHTGEKPYKCTLEGCGRRFSVVSNLRRHAKIHQNNHP